MPARFCVPPPGLAAGPLFALRWLALDPELLYSQKSPQRQGLGSLQNGRTPGEASRVDDSKNERKYSPGKSGSWLQVSLPVTVSGHQSLGAGLAGALGSAASVSHQCRNSLRTGEGSQHSAKSRDHIQEGAEPCGTGGHPGDCVVHV